MTKIIVGKTKFHSTYADGNAEWLVTKTLGRDVFEAKITPESLDYVGVTKAFRRADIVSALRMDDFWKRSAASNENFYDGLKVGEIVHYHNGFAQFVRCEVVRGIYEGRPGNVLKPIALVGEWRSFDLPSRNERGEITYPYNAKQIVDGATMTPHESNIFEHNPKSTSWRGVDPRSLAPVSLAVPDATPEEEARAALVRHIDSISEIIRNGYQSREDPAVTLGRIKKAVETLG